MDEFFRTTLSVHGRQTWRQVFEQRTRAQGNVSSNILSTQKKESNKRTQTKRDSSMVLNIWKVGGGLDSDECRTLTSPNRTHRAQVCLLTLTWTFRNAHWCSCHLMLTT